MGRYDFTARQVAQTVKLMKETGRIRRLPVWHETLQTIPPSEILTRPIHRAEAGRKKKLSRIFKPLPIHYPEDHLRVEFFGDHPWELARPKVVLENGGNDSKDWDWSKIQQPGKKLDGESVVQRQLWLMQNEGLSKATAYDKARKEFYYHRHFEDVERRVAREEALSTGGYFHKNALEVGMELEDAAWDNWRGWAQREITKAKQAQAASYTGEVEEKPETTENDSLEDSDPLAAPA